MKVQKEKRLSQQENQIIEMAKMNNGIITSTKVTEENIPRRVLSSLVESNLLIRVERGVYMLPEVWEDDLFTLQWRFSRGIFSHETALYIHKMSDRTPFKYTMTFPFGYNTSNVKKRGVIAKTTNKERYNLGLISTNSFNDNLIYVYNIERTLCDIVQTRHKADIQIVNQAMKLYASSRNKDIAKLLNYAKQLQVEPTVLNYMEILL